MVKSFSKRVLAFVITLMMATSVLTPLQAIAEETDSMASITVCYLDEATGDIVRVAKEFKGNTGEKFTESPANITGYEFVNMKPEEAVYGETSKVLCYYKQLEKTTVVISESQDNGLAKNDNASDDTSDTQQPVAKDNADVVTDNEVNLSATTGSDVNDSQNNDNKTEGKGETKNSEEPSTEKAEFGKIVIHVQNKEDKTPVTGFSFEIFDKDGVSHGIVKVDDEGVGTSADLLVGKYDIEEKEGHDAASGNKFKYEDVEVTANTKTSVTFYVSVPAAQEDDPQEPKELGKYLNAFSTSVDPVDTSFHEGEKFTTNIQFAGKIYVDQLSIELHPQNMKFDSLSIPAIAGVASGATYDVEKIMVLKTAGKTETSKKNIGTKMNAGSAHQIKAADLAFDEAHDSATTVVDKYYNIVFNAGFASNEYALATKDTDHIEVVGFAGLKDGKETKDSIDVVFKYGVGEKTASESKSSTAVNVVEMILPDVTVSTDNDSVQQGDTVELTFGALSFGETHPKSVSVKYEVSDGTFSSVSLGRVNGATGTINGEKAPLSSDYLKNHADIKYFEYELDSFVRQSELQIGETKLGINTSGIDPETVLTAKITLTVEGYDEDEPQIVKTKEAKVKITANPNRVTADMEEIEITVKVIDVDTEKGIDGSGVAWEHHYIKEDAVPMIEKRTMRFNKTNESAKYKTYPVGSLVLTADSVPEDYSVDHVDGTDEEGKVDFAQLAKKWNNTVTFYLKNNNPEPTAVPTEAPTTEPTDAPTEAPTTEPTDAPTDAPTEKPNVDWVNVNGLYFEPQESMSTINSQYTMNLTGYSVEYSGDENPVGSVKFIVEPVTANTQMRVLFDGKVDEYHIVAVDKDDVVYEMEKTSEDPSVVDFDSMLMPVAGVVVTDTTEAENLGRFPVNTAKVWVYAINPSDDFAVKEFTLTDPTEADFETKEYTVTTIAIDKNETLELCNTVNTGKVSVTEPEGTVKFEQSANSLILGDTITYTYGYENTSITKYDKGAFVFEFDHAIDALVLNMGVWENYAGMVDIVTVSADGVETAYSTINPTEKKNVSLNEVTIKALRVETLSSVPGDMRVTGMTFVGKYKDTGEMRANGAVAFKVSDKEVFKAKSALTSVNVNAPLPTATQQPTASPAPTSTPAPTATVAPTNTPDTTDEPTSTVEPETTVTPEPTGGGGGVRPPSIPTNTPTPTPLPLVVSVPSITANVSSISYADSALFYIRNLSASGMSTGDIYVLHLMIPAGVQVKSIGIPDFGGSARVSLVYQNSGSKDVGTFTRSDSAQLSDRDGTNVQYIAVQIRNVSGVLATSDMTLILKNISSRDRVVTLQAVQSVRDSSTAVKEQHNDKYNVVLSGPKQAATPTPKPSSSGNSGTTIPKTTSTVPPTKSPFDPLGGENGGSAEPVGDGFVKPTVMPDGETAGDAENGLTTDGTTPEVTESPIPTVEPTEAPTEAPTEEPQETISPETTDEPVELLPDVNQSSFIERVKNAPLWQKLVAGGVGGGAVAGIIFALARKKKKED